MTTDMRAKSESVKKHEKFQPKNTRRSSKLDLVGKVDEKKIIRTKCKILVFTAKDTETNAIKRHLSGPTSEFKTSRHEVVLSWKLKRPWENSKNDIEIALYEVGRGQEQAAIYCPPVLEAFSPDVVFFIGCAGGQPNVTQVGDVYIATHVWPYERAKVGLKTKRSKAHPIEPDRAICDQAKAVRDRGEWKRRIEKNFPKNINVIFGQIASGSKIITDEDSAEWKYIKTKISDDIFAVETEGSGFLASIIPFKTFALMIRGISDTFVNKDAHGKEVDDNNQSKATSNAMAFAIEIMERIDVTILRNIKNDASSKEIKRETITIKFNASWHDTAMILDQIEKLSNSPVSFVRGEDGSILLTVEVERKGAALIKLLEQLGVINLFFDHEVLSVKADVDGSGDEIFDSWLKYLKEKGTRNIYSKRRLLKLSADYQSRTVMARDEMAMHERLAKDLTKKKKINAEMKRVNPDWIAKISAIERKINDYAKKREIEKVRVSPKRKSGKKPPRPPKKGRRRRPNVKRAIVSVNRRVRAGSR